MLAGESVFPETRLRVYPYAEPRRTSRARHEPRFAIVGDILTRSATLSSAAAFSTRRPVLVVFASHGGMEGAVRAMKASALE